LIWKFVLIAVIAAARKIAFDDLRRHQIRRSASSTDWPLHAKSASSFDND
jgi:hypothetical protein